MGKDYPEIPQDVMLKTGAATPLKIWYEENKADVPDFEKQMRRKVHYVVKPDHLWNDIAHLARRQSGDLLETLREGFKYIENEFSTATAEPEIDLAETHKKFVEVERTISSATEKHNRFLKELGLPQLPGIES